MLSRLANLHGVMRGTFPLQVIRYLRGSGVVERLKREEELRKGCCRVETKPQTQRCLLQYFSIILYFDETNYVFQQKKAKSSRHKMNIITMSCSVQPFQ